MQKTEEITALIKRRLKQDEDNPDRREIVFKGVEGAMKHVGGFVQGTKIEQDAAKEERLRRQFESTKIIDGERDNINDSNDERTTKLLKEDDESNAADTTHEDLAMQEFDQTVAKHKIINPSAGKKTDGLVIPTKKKKKKSSKKKA